MEAAGGGESEIGRTTPARTQAVSASGRVVGYPFACQLPIRVMLRQIKA